MPGDSPQEAVTAFLEPLRDALAVLDGRGVITVSSRHGAWVKDKPYSWVLNAGNGMRLQGVGTFHASMQFQVIDTDPDTNDLGKRLRVTTLGYNYKLEQPDGDLWRMHWHPDGVSDVREPHLHVPLDLSMHLPCDRMTFETAIRWCIEYGAPLLCAPQEAEEQLLLSEMPHKLHRTWASPFDRPDLRRR